MIYLDYNATTPIDKTFAAAVRPFIDEHFGNPSSSRQETGDGVKIHI